MTNAMARDTKNRPSGKTGAAGKACAAQSAPPARKRTTSPLKFFSEVRQEGRKVTWTSRNETLVSTIMVVVMASFAALFFFGVDSIIGFVVNLLLGLGA